MNGITILRAGKSGAVVSISQDALAEFARKWPCFGNTEGRRVTAEFDSRGDLVDIDGDEGLDGSGMCALLDDVQALILRATPTWEAPGQRARLGC
jgi:hypothetical protein